MKHEDEVYRIGDKWYGISGGVYCGYNNKGEIMRFPLLTSYPKSLDIICLYRLSVDSESDGIIIDYDQDHGFVQACLWA